MPLQHIIYQNPHAIIGIWRLTEPEEFFLPHRHLLVRHAAVLDSIHHPQRRLEWLAGRYLVWQLAQRLHLPFAGIYTDTHNKPHLTAANGHISISHARPYVVAILNRQQPAGIDIEELRPKLQYLAPKFLTAGELDMAGNDLPRLAICWGAKEALYKLYGRKCLVFKENLLLSHLAFDGHKGRLQGVIRLAKKQQTYHLLCGRFGNHVLVFTVEE